MCRRMTNTDRVVLPALAWLAAAVAVGSVDPASAKSLYVLGGLGAEPGKLLVYDIQESGLLAFKQRSGEIAFEGESLIFPSGQVAMGIALDSKNDFLFVGCRSFVTVVDAKTLTVAGSGLAKSSCELARLSYDHDKKSLYCAERYKDSLFEFDWASSTTSLTEKKDSPATLANAWCQGIALDETRDLLYVACLNDPVRVFQTSNWSLVKTLQLSHPATSIAVDFNRQVIYTGGGYTGDLDLVRYDLTSGQERSVQVSPGAGVAGVAVDNETGLVYVTTGEDNASGGGCLKVYSPTLSLMQSLHLGGNPTGLVVSLSWTPPGVTNHPTAGISEVGGVAYAQPGDLVTYEVCLDSRADLHTLTGVVVEDQLPAEVNFVRVEGLAEIAGAYDPATHAFVYNRGTLEPNTTACFNLVVQVKEEALPGTTMTSLVTISSNEADPNTAATDVTVAYAPLHLTKQVVDDPNHVVVGDLVYIDAGSSLTYEVSIANPDNTYPIPEAIVVDTLPEEVDFVSVDGDDGVGYYDPNLHAYYRVYATFDPGTETHFWVTVWVHENVAAGTIITNSVWINDLWTPPTTAKAEVLIKQGPLTVSKTIVSPVNPDGGTVLAGVGETVTYQICVDNNDSNFVTHNVSVVDVLPTEVDFVSTGSGGVYDANLGTCTWAMSSLVPGERVCTELVVRVKGTAALQQTVTNTVVADSDETPPVQASAQFLTGEIVLQVSNLELLYSEAVCKGCSSQLQAVLTLPASVKRQDVNANEKLVLDPGGAKTTSQIVYGYDGKVKIRAFFDTTQLLASVEGYGRATVTVRGWLQSGRRFEGQKDILITSVMRRK